jgi:hypothetical protein
MRLEREEEDLLPRGHVRESLLAIPPILKLPKKPAPPLPPKGLDMYTVNTAVLLQGYDLSVDFFIIHDDRYKEVENYREASNARTNVKATLLSSRQ